MSTKLDRGLIVIWRLFFGAAALQGASAIWTFIKSRSEGGSLSGFSFQAVLFIAVGSALLFFCAWQLFSSFLSPHKIVSRATRWRFWINKPDRFGYFIIFFSSLLVVCAYCLTLVGEVEEPFSRAILANLSPFLTWICGLCVQALLLMAVMYQRKNKVLPKSSIIIFGLVMVYFLFVLKGWSWLSGSLYPILSERVGWNSLGVPLIEHQTFLAWLIGVLVLFILCVSNLKKLRDFLHLQRGFWLVDLFIATCLWGSAVLIWQSQPIQPNWFVSERLAPNHEYYPYSDARAYDENAQSALIGNGYLHYNNIEIRRPLHAAYLTILHLVGGQRYEKVILLQLMLLALIPVGLYAVTSSIHNRASGVMAAVLIIFRESNSISIGSNITSSHAKLLMVDLLTTLFVVIFIYWAIRWLKRIEISTSIDALISGGILGLAMLIRSETFVLSLAPIILSALILLPRRKLRHWFFQLVTFYAGILLVISPWMVRNWQRTGSFTLDSAVFRQLIIIQRFRPLEQIPNTQSLPELPPTTQTTVDPNFLPAQTEEVVTIPVQTLQPTETSSEVPHTTIASSLLEDALRHPGDLAKVFAAHYLNNQIQMMLIHPAALRPVDSVINFLGHKKIDKYFNECCSLIGYTRRLPFWKKWDGNMPQQSMIPLIMTSIFLAVGLTVSYRRKSAAGLVPAAAAFIYILFNSALRNSGGRYLLPVDWTSIVYFSIGSVQLTLLTSQLIRQKKDAPTKYDSRIDACDRSNKGHPLRSGWFFAAIIGLLVFGISIPLIEVGIPDRYSAETRDQMLNTFFSVETNVSEHAQQKIEGFLAAGGKAIVGRGLYPQIFASGYGTGESKKGPRSPKPYPRLVFDLVSTLTLDITLPLDGEPAYFPNGSDTLVFLCLDEVRARAEPLAVAVFDSDGQIAQVYLRSPFPDSPSCPFPDIP